MGSLTSSPPPRHVALEGQVNFRDLGGYETSDGRTIAWGRVYRSGHLATLTDADVARLGEVGIRTVASLLTGDDVERYGAGRLPAGTEELRLPIESDLPRLATAALCSGASAVPSGLNSRIHHRLIEDGRRQYAELLRLAADRDRHPLVFHCSHGVHRAGTAAAVLLAALGVPWAAIRADYLRERLGLDGSELEALREALLTSSARPRRLPWVDRRSTPRPGRRCSPCRGGSCRPRRGRP